MLMNTITKYGILDWNRAENVASELDITENDFLEHIRMLNDEFLINAQDIDPVATVLKIALNEFNSNLENLSNQSVIDLGIYVYSNALDSNIDNVDCLDNLLEDIASNINDGNYIHNFAK